MYSGGWDKIGLGRAFDSCVLRGIILTFAILGPRRWAIVDSCLRDIPVPVMTQNSMKWLTCVFVS